MPPKKTTTAKATSEIESDTKQTQKKQDEDNRLPIETEQVSPKKKTGAKGGRPRKKSEAEKLQEEASGFIERVNKKSEVGDDSTEEENDEEQTTKKKNKAPTARAGKRQPAKTMPKHDEQDEEDIETSPPSKAPTKGKGMVEDDEAENEGDSPSKKTKGKTTRKQGPKGKINPPEVENETEQNDENETKKKTTATTTGRKGKGPGSSKKQLAASNDNDEAPVNDELKLSEDEEGADEKPKGATAKKAPTKRAAPASGKKTAITSAKKKGQNDEPFDDRTNDEVDDNIEDEPSTAKQPKKGRSADKAPASASKPTARGGKKAKAT